MSTINSTQMKNQLGMLFNLLGVYVTHKRPVTTTNSYGEEEATSFEEQSIKSLPYNQNASELFQAGFGDLDFGSQYFAFEADKDVKTNDLINYNGADYVVNRVTHFSWGEIVMFAVQAKYLEQSNTIES